MPLKAFWALNREIPRLRSEENLHRYNSVGAAFSGGEDSKKYIKGLQEEVESAAKRPDVFDRDGWNQLKLLARSQGSRK